MTCPASVKDGQLLCLTCFLAGVVRCPKLGTPLPLVEGERRRVLEPSGEERPKVGVLLRPRGRKP